MSSSAQPLLLFQVELTNHCNLKCSYCPQPGMRRPKGFMSAALLDRCIAVAKQQCQARLALHHFGEPLMHVDLESRLRQVAESGLEIQFSTNGLLLERKWSMLLRLGAPVHVILSAHLWLDGEGPTYFQALAQWQERAAGTNITIKKAYNSTDDALTYHAWDKGTMRKWDYMNQCQFLRNNWAVVLWNGDVASCCVDCEGESVFAHITDADVVTRHTKPWRACPSCDLMGR